MRKNLIKWILIAVASALLVGSVVCFMTCGKKNRDHGSSSESSSEGQTVGITISPEEINVFEYETVTLTAKVDGTDEPVVWSTSDGSVATVNEDGKVYGVKQGIAEITAEAGNASAKCTVNVKKTVNVPVVKFTDEITVEKGRKYVGELKVFFNEEDVTDESEIVWSPASDLAEGVCGVENDGGKVTFCGKETGEAGFFAAVTVKGVYVNKSVKVKVVERIVNVVPVCEAISSGTDGYTINLCTAGSDGKFSSAELSFVVYDGDKAIGNAEIEWDTGSGYYNPEIATISGTNGNYTVAKVSAGRTRLDGTYTSSDNKTVRVCINVVVEKATVTLSERIVIEVEDLKESAGPGEIEDNINAVMLGGKDILAGVNGGKMTFDQSKLPVKADELGENELIVSTADRNYRLPAEIYSLIVSDPTEFDRMRESARKNGDVENTGVLDGYFVLDSDIDYNGVFTSMTDTGEIWSVNNALKGGSWHNGAKYGFKGIFDGRGYNIDGLSVKPISSSQSGGILGYMNNAGIFRNVSFTNAAVSENSGYICSIGGGLIENVSISFGRIGAGNENRELDTATPRRMGAFFSYMGLDSSIVRNCVVNAIGARICFERSPLSGMSNIRLGGGAKTVENLIVLCDGEFAAEILSDSGASYTAKTYGEFVSDEGCLGAIDEFDGKYWTSINGIPLLVRSAGKIDRTQNIEFIGLPSEINTGSEIDVKTNVEYCDVAIEGLYEGVSYEGGLLIVSENAENGEITVTATSLINGSTDSRVIAINHCEKVSIPHDRILIEQTKTEIDLSFASGYIGNKASVYYGMKLLGSGTPDKGKLTVDLTGITDTGESTFVAYGEKDGVNYLFDINVRIVTRIIRKAEDLAVLRITQKNIDNDVSVKGIYVLANDIDMKGATIGGELKYNNGGSVPVYRADFGFLGTFEGNKHTISNFKVSAGGIFGHIGKGALVTDVTFDNVTYEPEYLTALFAVTARGAKFANVKINVSGYGYEQDQGYAHGFISSRYMTDCSLTNVIINAKECDVFSVFGFSILGENKCNNVVVKVKSYSVLGYNGDYHAEEYAITEMKGVKVTAVA